MSKPLIILGTGGSAYDVLDIVEAINARTPTWQVCGFLDDAGEIGSSHLGFEILGRLSDASRFGDCFFINVIGSDKSFRKRPAILASTGIPSDRFATLVHPLSCVSTRARLGRGVYVAAGASVGGSATIGDHVSISPGVIVGHDSILQDFAIVAPGAVVSGFVRVGSSAYLGARSVIRQHVQIGEQALVGMGAVVLRDVLEESVVVGNPARLIQRAN